MYKRGMFSHYQGECGVGALNSFTQCGNPFIQLLDRIGPTALLHRAIEASNEVKRVLPVGVLIGSKNGAMTPSTGRYSKRLNELRGIYRDQVALDAILAAGGDIVVYDVLEFIQPGADIGFGTTTMYPGRVGDEFFMTRGHFHKRRDRGEIYYTQSGEGLLLLESRGGETRTVDMKPGSCAFIPPDWAHRSINTGNVPLVFVWVCNPDAGHDYGEILARGMRKLVVSRDDGMALMPNPNFAN